MKTGNEWLDILNRGLYPSEYIIDKDYLNDDIWNRKCIKIDFLEVLENDIKFEIRKVDIGVGYGDEPTIHHDHIPGID